MKIANQAAHEALTSSGWKHIEGQGNDSFTRYKHSDKVEHIHIESNDGDWTHYGSPIPGVKLHPTKAKGKGVDSLKAHLGSSQHSEAPLPPREVADILLDLMADDEQFSEEQPLPGDKPATKHRQPADEDHANELHLIDQANVRKLDHHAYGRSGEEERGEHHLHQHREAILANLDKKKAKGTYDHEKAKKLWGFFAKNLSDHVAKHHGKPKANPATRALAAAKLADHYNSLDENDREPSSDPYNPANLAAKPDASSQHTEKMTPERAEELATSRFTTRKSLAAKYRT